MHQALGLEAGLKLPGGPWPGFLLMCAGVGSPGTLREVLRGYTGDRSAAQIFDDEEWVEAFPLPRFRGLCSARPVVLGSSDRLSSPPSVCAT